MLHADLVIILGDIFMISDKECVRRIDIAAGAMKECSGVCSQRNLSFEAKFRLYSTYIVPILLYSSETWFLTKTE